LDVSFKPLGDALQGAQSISLARPKHASAFAKDIPPTVSEPKIEPKTAKSGGRKHKNRLFGKFQTPAEMLNLRLKLTNFPYNQCPHRRSRHQFLGMPGRQCSGFK
jgi:hypothetical protein